MDFLQVLKDSGIPTTAEELWEIWKAVLVSSGSKISNDVTISPFYRFIRAAITEPVLWLVRFMALTILPNAYVKYASGQFLDLLADAVNITRKPSSKMRGTITFTRANTSANITVPIGTIIQTVSIFGVIYRLATIEQKAFSSGELTVEIMAEAVASGSDFNLAAGYYAILLVPIAGVSSVSNTDGYIISPGADIEADDALRARIRNQFNSVGDYHTDAVYRGMIAEFDGVSIDNIFFVHDAPRGPGTANAYILFDFSVSADDYLTAINAFITDQGNHGHGDDLLVLQMPESPVELGVVVYITSFLSVAEQAALSADIELFINAAFRENKAFSPTLTKPYSRFSLSKLSKELHEQFPAIQSIDFSRDDIICELFIPRLADISINIEVG